MSIFNMVYSGKYKYNYNYIFKGKTATEIGSTWSTLAGTLSTNSDGVCGNSGNDCRIGFNIPSLAYAKKITILGTVVVNSLKPSANACHFGIGTGSGWGTGYAMNRLEGSSFSGTFVSVKTNNTTINGNTVGTTTQGIYTQKVIIDLENKTMTGSVSGFNDSIITLTDAQIAEIRTFTYLLVFVSLNYSAVSDISISIE